jgi:hypothetical protein
MITRPAGWPTHSVTYADLVRRASGSEASGPVASSKASFISARRRGSAMSESIAFASVTFAPRTVSDLAPPRASRWKTYRMWPRDELGRAST